MKFALAFRCSLFLCTFVSAGHTADSTAAPFLTPPHPSLLSLPARLPVSYPPAAFRPDVAYNCSNIRDFDDAITRVAFGWPSVDAYYEGSSSADVVDKIAIPYLSVQVHSSTGE